jgi:hypothetical protein
MYAVAASGSCIRGISQLRTRSSGIDGEVAGGQVVGADLVEC